MMPERIFLTGFMGSGKSTIGRILANVLGYAFTDLDEEIEHAEGRSVSQIFAEDGEAYFRRAETEALTRVAQSRRQVLALGGGTLAQPPNLALLQTLGCIVYLHVPPDMLAQRLQTVTNRPLLLDEAGQRLPLPQLQQRITTLLTAREAVYRQAHIFFPVKNVPVGVVVDQLERTLRKFWPA